MVIYGTRAWFSFSDFQAPPPVDSKSCASESSLFHVADLVRHYQVSGVFLLAKSNIIAASRSQASSSSRENLLARRLGRRFVSGIARRASVLRNSRAQDITQRGERVSFQALWSADDVRAAAKSAGEVATRSPPRKFEVRPVHRAE